MSHAKARIDTYDFLRQMLGELSVIPGLRGAYILDADQDVLVGAGRLPAAGLPILRRYGRERRGYRELAPQFIQTPMGRFHLQALDRNLTLAVYGRHELAPGLLHRVVAPLAQRIDGVLRDALRRDATLPGSDHARPRDPDSGLFWE